MTSICQTVHNCVSIYGKPCSRLQEEIITLVTQGIPLLRALEVYLILPEDFAKMKVLAEGGDTDLLEFAHKCMLAETSFQIALIQTAMKSPSSSARLLEGRFPQTWKNYTESDLEKMSPEELQRFIEANEQKQLLIDITNKGS